MLGVAEVPGLPKLNPGLETMRAGYRLGQRVAGLFVNLNAVEQGVLNSRMLEYPFVIAKLDGCQRGRVLDVGCTDGGNLVAPILASLGWEVYGVDTRHFGFRHPNFRFVHEDVREMSFPDDFFDCAYAISTLEHVGLAGRYAVRVDDPDGDFRAVAEVRRVVRPGGRFLLTVPYGRGGVVRPMERVYSRERLRRLLARWAREDERYWYLDNAGEWHEVSEETAARTRTPGGVAIAMLELVPSDQESG